MPVPRGPRASSRSRRSKRLSRRLPAVGVRPWTTTAGPSSSACAQRHRPVPARLPGRAADRVGARRARRPRGGRGDRRRVPRRGPADRPARLRQGRVPRPRRTARGGSRCTRARTCSATSPSTRSPTSTSATSIGIDGTAFRVRRGELTLAVDDWTLLAKSLAPAARQVPRARGHRDALPPPRARPDRQRGGARAVHPALEGGRRDRGAGSTSAASSRSRRRCSSRSTAARWRGPSPPTTTRSTATSTCGSPPSCTSSA